MTTRSNRQAPSAALSQAERVGERIRRLRQERGLSQRDIAGPGVSAAYISRIEKGDREPSIRALRGLAERLGVSADLLETGRDAVDIMSCEVDVADAELELRFADNPAAAAEKFSRLLRAADAAGDRDTAGRARAGLGLSAAQRGDYDEAVELLESVMEAGSISYSTDPDVPAALARSYMAQGRCGEAILLLRRCLDELRDRESPRAAYVRLATFLSYALSDLGDLEGARQALDDALAAGEGFADAESRVRLYWSSARLAALAGDHAMARAQIRRAMGVFEQLEDVVHLARAHLLNVENLLSQGDIDGASEHLAIATTLLGAGSMRRDQAWLALLRAQVLIARGDHRAAQREAKQAVELSDDRELRGRAQTAAGEAFALHGSASKALEKFGCAERELLGGESRFLLALYERWSQLLEAEGRLEDALGVMRRATSLAGERNRSRIRAGRVS